MTFALDFRLGGKAAQEKFDKARAPVVECARKKVVVAPSRSIHLASRLIIIHAGAQHRTKL